MQELAPVELAGQRATALALVFSELLSNALEHGGEHVSIVLRHDDDEALLVVADDGVGVEGSDRKSTRLNSSHLKLSRMPSSA